MQSRAGGDGDGGCECGQAVAAAARQGRQWRWIFSGLCQLLGARPWPVLYGSRPNNLS